VGQVPIMGTGRKKGLAGTDLAGTLNGAECDGCIIII
jgi:hypothetical protein